MKIINYLLLFVWAFILLGTVCYLIKQLAFGRKKDETLNTSEGIYLASLIFSAAIIFKEIVRAISVSYDNVIKLYPNGYYLQLVKTSSVLSVCGILILVVSFLVAKLLSKLFFGRSKAISEFAEDNNSYAIVTGALVITVSYVFLQLAENIIQFLIPSINIPLYR